MLYIPPVKFGGKLVLEAIDICLYSQSVGIFLRRINDVSVTEIRKAAEVMIFLCQRKCGCLMTTPTWTS